eukprot:scaffold1165_cov323-Prasinococcus_capsulatus_cf.AAC.7
MGDPPLGMAPASSHDASVFYGGDAKGRAAAVVSFLGQSDALGTGEFRLHRGSAAVRWPMAGVHARMATIGGRARSYTSLMGHATESGPRPAWPLHLARDDVDNPYDVQDIKVAVRVEITALEATFLQFHHVGDADDDVDDQHHVQYVGLQVNVDVTVACVRTPRAAEHDSVDDNQAHQLRALEAGGEEAGDGGALALHACGVVVVELHQQQVGARRHRRVDGGVA